MILFVDLAQIASVQVRVYLRRRDIGMTQHLLDGCDIGSTLQQMCGKRMP
jgi:hypothetical protein